MSNFGYFENEKEYVFTNYAPTRPMLNYFWNDWALSGVNQNGGGNGAYGDYTLTYVDQKDRGRCNVIRKGNRYFYLRDSDNGTVFNPGWYPSKTPLDQYRCTHGLGYSIFEATCQEIKVHLRGFMGAKYPCEIWTLEVTNESQQPRNIQVYPFVEFQLEGYVANSDYNSYVYARHFEKENLIVCHNDAMEKKHDWYHGFLASSRTPEGFDTSKKAFLGEYNFISLPLAIENGNCSQSLAACEQMVGAQQHNLHLAPGESQQFHILIGCTDGDKTAQKIQSALFTPGAIETEFQNLLESKEQMAEKVKIHTPDGKINLFANYWLKQQVQLCAQIGRDGTKGFRDQLQDAWAVSAFNPKLARDKILETLRYQYADGRCERGWLPVKYHVYSDGPVWISPTINGYMKECGDYSILEEVVPYFDQGSGTVLDHMLIALRRSFQDVGEHGLVHALEGDWNDSLNMIGLKGKGESIWTSIALTLALKEMAEIAQFVLLDEKLYQEMMDKAQVMTQAVNKSAWDGSWYLAAFNDEGQKVGSKEETQGQVYLNSQTWAILAGIATEQRLNSCLETLDTLLDSPYGPLTLYPPYTSFNPTIGRLTSFVPGIWENGTPYCHGGTFKIVSDCVCGRGNEAYQSIMKILPDSQWNPSEKSGCEPYALTNMYFGPSNPRKGETLYAWVTGTAGWMLRAITQYMLGFHPGYTEVVMDPCLPSAWDTCSLQRHFRDCLYHVTIHNPNGVQKGVAQLYLDGTLQPGNSFPLCKDGEVHEVLVVMG